MNYAIYYGSGVRGDGHGNSRDYFHAVCLEFHFSEWQCWMYHGEGGQRGGDTLGEQPCDYSQQ